MLKVLISDKLSFRAADILSERGVEVVGRLDLEGRRRHEGDERSSEE